MTRCCKRLKYAGLTVVFLFVNMFSITASAQSPKLNIKVSVSTAMVKAGETFDVTISLFNYSDMAIQDIGGIQIDVPVDTEYLEYIDKTGKVLLKHKAGDFISSEYDQSRNQYTFMYANTNANKKALSRINTDIISLRFRLIKGIPETKTFDITCKAAIFTTDTPSNPILTDVFFAQICSSDSASPKNENPPTDSSNTINLTDGNGTADSKLRNIMVIPIIVLVIVAIIILMLKKVKNAKEREAW